MIYYIGPIVIVCLFAGGIWAFCRMVDKCMKE